jgi:hypothetical protein
MAIKTENVPQLFNLALATSTIVTVGDAVQDLIEKQERLPPGKPAVLAALLGYILFWSTKIFVDDNEVLRGGKTKDRHGLDLIFLVASYSFLICAAAALTSEYFLGLLLAHFLTLTLWVLVSYGSQPPGKARPASNGEAADYRAVWLFGDLLAVAVLVLMSFTHDVAWWWVGTAALYLIMAFDFWGSETLKRKKLLGEEVNASPAPQERAGR